MKAVRAVLEWCLIMGFAAVVGFAWVLSGAVVILLVISLLTLLGWLGFLLMVLAAVVFGGVLGSMWFDV